MILGLLGLMFLWLAPCCGDGTEECCQGTSPDGFARLSNAGKRKHLMMIHHARIDASYARDNDSNEDTLTTLHDEMHTAMESLRSRLA